MPMLSGRCLISLLCRSSTCKHNTPHWWVDWINDWSVGYWLIDYWLIGWLIEWLIVYWLIGWLIEWLIDYWLIGWLIEWLIDYWLIGWSIEWLIDYWLIDWLIDYWLISWLIEWLVGYMSNWILYLMKDLQRLNTERPFCIKYHQRGKTHVCYSKKMFLILSLAMRKCI